MKIFWLIEASCQGALIEGVQVAAIKGKKRENTTEQALGANMRRVEAD